MSAWRTLVALVTSVLVVPGIVRPAVAQIAMPDPKQMSGIPRPVSDLPDHTVSVRLIRGELSNNLVSHPVELVVDGKARTATTNENGRAEFTSLPPGAVLKAVAVVDGERLESQEFPAPAQGGIRVMLVATDKEKAARDAEAASAPPVKGSVSLAGETRIVIEPDEEIARVYYLLDITNRARTPVTPETSFEFDAPSGAGNVTIMEGSSPQAAVIGTHVKVNGPFAPGSTFVQVAFSMPLSGGELAVVQAFPAAVERVGVIAKKVGDARLSSPQIERQQDMPAGGAMYIAAAGGAVNAGTPIALTLSGMPHHSTVPVRVALGLAAVVVLAGVFAARRPGTRGERSRQARNDLIARRERLFQELLKIESDHRRGRLDDSRYADRREELMAALERVYGELDADEPSPEPTGVAA